MSEEEKFDDIIRQKFAEKEFIFNEANWEKAEQKMNSAKRISKIVRWTAVFSIGLLSGVAIMLPFVGNKNDKSVNEVTSVTDKVKSGNETAEARKEGNDNIVSEEVKSENQPGEKEVAGSNAEKKIAADNSLPEMKTESSAAPLRETTPEKNNERKVSASGKTNQGKVFADHEKSPVENESGKLNKQTSYQPKKEIYSKERNNNPVSSDKKLQQPVASGKEPESKNVLAQNVSNISDRSAKNSQGDNSSANTSEQHETPAAQSQISGETTVLPTKENNNLTAEKQEQKNAEVELNQKAAIQIPAKESVKSKLDSSTVASQNNPAEQPSKRGLASATFFSIEVGTNFNLGWKYHDTVEARGFNPIVGIGFTHYFNPTWALYAGIQYGSVANLKASQRTFSSQNFDFGSKSVDTVVDTKLLYYVVLPIQFQYHFNSKNSIGVGGSISYLVNTKSTVTINTVSNDSLQTIGTSKTEAGYYKGAFNRWDASFSVAYRRKILEKFSVTASVNYGLLDIKSNAFFAKDKFERNIGFKIVFTYDLFQY